MTSKDKWSPISKALADVLPLLSQTQPGNYSYMSGANRTGASYPGTYDPATGQSQLLINNKWSPTGQGALGGTPDQYGWQMPTGGDLQNFKNLAAQQAQAAAPPPQQNSLSQIGASAGLSPADIAQFQAMGLSPAQVAQRLGNPPPAAPIPPPSYLQSAIGQPGMTPWRG